MWMYMLAKSKHYIRKGESLSVLVESFKYPPFQTHHFSAMPKSVALNQETIRIMYDPEYPMLTNITAKCTMTFLKTGWFNIVVTELGSSACYNQNHNIVVIVY
jgi:hypothetical protein